MGHITVQWLMDFESRMRLIQNETYQSLVAAENQWWGEITKVQTTGSLRELLSWILATAQIEDAGEDGGNINFQDMAMLQTDFRVRFANSGLKLKRSQLLDQDGNGLNLAKSWVSQVTSMSAYWPQKQVTTLLKNGASAGYTAYDGLTFFNAAHPNNPHRSGAGIYSNLITSVPIDVSVSVDIALNNLQSVRGKIASVLQPNGVDPRFLKPVGMLCNSTLYPRAVQLTNAKYIAQTAGASGTAGGAADIEALIQSLGFGRVIEVPELNEFESNTTYFVIAKPSGVPDDELSGFVYLDREGFRVKYYTGEGGGAVGIDAVLDRANELEWHCEGRNTAGYGHPYLVYKCTAS